MKTKLFSSLLCFALLCGTLPGANVTFVDSTPTPEAEKGFKILGTRGISTVAVDVPGTGYTSVPTVAFSGGTGSGAAATAKLKVVGSVTITAPGTAHAIADVLTLVGGTKTTAATFTVSNLEVVSATVAAAGTSGTPGSATITGTTGTGTKFQATVTIGAGGTLDSIDEITVGGDYTVGPTLAAQPVTGGSLSGATVNVVMGVKAVTITNAGSYSVPVTTTGAATTTSGSGTGATLTVGYGVATVTVTSNGQGYTSAPTVAFSGGAGADAAATASLPAHAAVNVRFRAILPLSNTVLADIVGPTKVYTGTPYSADNAGLEGKTLVAGVVYPCYGNSVTITSGLALLILR